MLPRGRWEGDSALSGLPQERGRRLLTGRWGVSLTTSSSSALPQGLPRLGPWRGAGLCPQALLCQLQMPGQPESWCSPSSASQGLYKEPPCSPCLPVTARSGGARQQEEVPGLGTSPWTEVGAVTRRQGPVGTGEVSRPEHACRGAKGKQPGAAAACYWTPSPGP